MAEGCLCLLLKATGRGIGLVCKGTFRLVKCVVCCGGCCGKKGGDESYSNV
jgi:hypothetical protein